MQPLEYETPQPLARASWAVLFIVPAAAMGLALFFIHYNANEEPFMVFDAADAALHIAVPLLSLGLWLYWGVQARRRKLSVFAFVPMVLLAALKLWFISLVGISYFSEGWSNP